MKHYHLAWETVRIPRLVEVSEDDCSVPMVSFEVEWIQQEAANASYWAASAARLAQRLINAQRDRAALKRKFLVTKSDL